MCIESFVGFPFMPLTKNLEAWYPVPKKNSGYSESDLKILDFVKSELGDNPQTQTKVFSTTDFLNKESKVWCEIGGMFVNSR